MLSSFPKSDWDTNVWPTIININTELVSPVPMDELTTLYDAACSIEDQKRSDAILADTPDEAKIVTAFKNSGTKGTYELAQYIINKFNIITIGEAEREMYVYQDGIYRRAENEVILPEIQRVLKNIVTRSAKSETHHKIADATAKPRSVFESAPLNLIPLRNGVYDFANKTLLKHSPGYKFTFQFPIIYDPKATCPVSSKFMDDILTPEQRETMEEWLGYYFYRVYAFKKAMIIVGEGDTGKTTLLEMINHLLGQENISGVSLHKISGDKFAGAQMYGKHANIVDELEAKDVVSTGNFKVATGGGSISGEYKFGNQFSFQNFAKLTFACNQIPDVKETDDKAYFNRWMVIRLEKTIEKKIYNFVAQLRTEEERSGLFNIAMVGLDRLLKQGRFTFNKDAVDTKLEMMRGGSSIAQFASDGVYQKLGNEITKEDMYKSYSNFCTENNLSTETMEMFGRKFMSYVAYVSDKNMTVNGKRARGWVNVAIHHVGKSEDMAINKAEDAFDKLDEAVDN